jgi:alpha-galactosidase
VRNGAKSVTYTDPATGLVVRCEAKEFADVPAVEWVVWLENRGKEDTPIVERLAALDWGLPLAAKDTLTLHHAEGEHNTGDSFKPVDETVSPGARVVLAPVAGRSSDGTMPFFGLDWPGGGVTAAIGWSGQWEASFERQAGGAVRVVCGQQLTHLKLHPGERVRTPRMLLVFWKGGDPERGTNLLRQAILAHYTPRRNGEIVFAPICGAAVSPRPDATYTTYKLRAIPQLAKLGYEVLWSDCDPEQWYPVGFPTGTGTWDPDPAKYPKGFKPVGDAARKSGVGFLLWFEPERVHPGSRIDREHPEWVMKANGEWSQLFRLQDPVARKWVTDYVDKQVTDAQLSWMRWDFNIGPLGFWQREDTPDRQGVTENLYIQGLYAMWDDLMHRHPGMIVDMCASGGRRIDLEALSRGLPLWHSDMQCNGALPAADQLQNAGLNRWIPFHGCGCFGDEPDYNFRSAMTAGNIVIATPWGQTRELAPAAAEAAKRTVGIYTRLRPYFLGDFHPLLPHEAGEDKWFAYQFHRADLDAGLVMAFRRAECAADRVALSLRSVDPKASYAVTFEDTGATRTMSGRELASLAVTVSAKPGSAIVTYRRKSGKSSATE